MPRRTAAVSAQVLCTPYNTSLQCFFFSDSWIRSVPVTHNLYWLPSFCTGCLRSVMVAFVLYCLLFVCVLVSFILYRLPFVCVLVSFVLCWFPSLGTGFLHSVLVFFVLYWFPSFCTVCLLYLCVFVSFVLYWFPSFGTGCLRSVLIVLISPSCCFADEGSTRNILIPGFSLLLSAG